MHSNYRAVAKLFSLSNFGTKSRNLRTTMNMASYSKGSVFEKASAKVFANSALGRRWFSAENAVIEKPMPVAITVEELLKYEQPEEFEPSVTLINTSMDIGIQKFF